VKSPRDGGLTAGESPATIGVKN